MTGKLQGVRLPHGGVQTCVLTVFDDTGSVCVWQDQVNVDIHVACVKMNWIIARNWWSGQTNNSQPLCKDHRSFHRRDKSSCISTSSIW